MDGPNPGALGDSQAFPPGSWGTRDNERGRYGRDRDLEPNGLV